MPRKEYRMEQGSPYMFCVSSNKIKEAENPYKESVPFLLSNIQVQTLIQV